MTPEPQTVNPFSIVGASLLELHLCNDKLRECAKTLVDNGYPEIAEIISAAGAKTFEAITAFVRKHVVVP